MIRRSRPQPPCRDCKERVPGCHSQCEKWAKYKEADAIWLQLKERQPEVVTNYFVMQTIKIRKAKEHKTKH